MDQRENKHRSLARQIARLDRRIAALKKQSDVWVQRRIFIVVGAVIAGFLGFQVTDFLGWLGLLIGTVVFVLVARIHGQVKQTITLFQNWQQIKRLHVARMTLDWAHLPPPTVTQPPPDHPFALDLDMLGEHSVHQLLDTAVTTGGSRRLLDWLLAEVPDSAQLASRQSLVRELIPLEAFRDRLSLAAAIAAGERRGRWDGSALRHWLEQDMALPGLNRGLAVLAALSVVNIALFIGFSAGLLPPVWAITLTIYLFMSANYWRLLAGFFDRVLSLQSHLVRLSAVLHHLETYGYGKRARLAALCAPFTESGRRPSLILRSVGWTAAAASLQRNPIVWLALNFVVPWDIFFALRLEQHKQALRERVPIWLETLYDLEALNALATFATLNPDYVFPSVHDRVAFNGVQLGHPLIDHERRICNDFTLDSAGQVVILTGSNMSGKSSFLRTLGVNLQIAYAGGVVAAESLDVGLFRVFTSIRVTDSLADGFSYFYAEVRRLRALLDALHDETQPPLFFLIDEIFRGTNNRERLTGSRAYIRALVGAHGMGIIATHDLELVKLADESPLTSNYHFREDVEDGTIVFDYRLREGPCPTTNALKIMALEGLPVDDEV